jgi:hypothetical protein
MNHTIASVGILRLSSLIDATAYHAVPQTRPDDHPESCVHVQVIGQALTFFGTDGVCASWGSINVEAGDTESMAINAKDLTGMIRKLRKACGRKRDETVTLSRIDGQLRMEACGESTEALIRSSWDKYHWIMTPPENDLFTDVIIDTDAAFGALKSMGNDRVKLSVSAADDTAKQWIDLHAAHIDDKRVVTYELLHTIGTGMGAHEHESRDVFLYAHTFRKLLRHTRKRALAKLWIHKRWLHRNYGCVAIHDGIATHVITPSEPIK